MAEKSPRGSMETGRRADADADDINMSRDGSVACEASRATASVTKILGAPTTTSEGRALESIRIWIATPPEHARLGKPHAAKGSALRPEIQMKRRSAPSARSRLDRKVQGEEPLWIPARSRTG